MNGLGLLAVVSVIVGTALCVAYYEWVAGINRIRAQRRAYVATVRQDKEC
jgi:hypothetical protein